MKLIITTNDGEVIQKWEIERDFGNLKYSMPRQTLLSDIVNEWKRYKKLSDIVSAWKRNKKKEQNESKNK